MVYERADWWESVCDGACGSGGSRSKVEDALNSGRLEKVTTGRAARCEGGTKSHAHQHRCSPTNTGSESTCRRFRPRVRPSSPWDVPQFANDLSDPSRAISVHSPSSTQMRPSARRSRSAGCRRHDPARHLDRRRRSYRCRGARDTRRQTGNHRRRRPRPSTSGALNADRSVVIASAFAVGVRVDLVPAAGGVAPAARPWARVVVEQQAATGSVALPELAGVRREELDGVSSNGAERR